MTRKLPDTPSHFCWLPSCQMAEFPDFTSEKQTEARAQIAALKDLVLDGCTIRMTPSGPVADSEQLEDQHLFCLTSGATGQPKGIKRRAKTWTMSFHINAEYLKLASTDQFATFGPLVNSLPLYATLEAAQIGASLAPLYGIRPDRQAELLSDLGTSVLYLTPTQLAQLLAAARPLAQVRLAMIGGGKLSRDLRVLAEKYLPNARIVEFFGSAETSFISLADADAPAGSVGKPYPGVALEIRPFDLSGDGRTGEIWVRSPYLFEGYAPGGSSNTRWDGDALSIGELGYLDETGHLFLQGRRERMVTISDRNVFLDPIERFLQENLPQTHLAVIAGPCPKRGHRLHVIMQDVPDKAVVENALLRCRDAFGPHAAPRAQHAIAAMPVLPSGKTDYAALETRIRLER